MSDDAHLVYSTDPAANRKCPKCKRLAPECVCRPEKRPAPGFTAILRVEKSGRGGKTVTVIDRLPRHPRFLEELAKKLKSKCGSGGTFYIEEHGVIEIQGDKRDLVRQLLTKEGIAFKG